MSHGDHKSHKAVVDLVREYNRLDRGNLAIMLDTKGPEVRSGDIAEPIEMKAGKRPLALALVVQPHSLSSQQLLVEPPLAFQGNRRMQCYHEHQQLLRCFKLPP